MSRRIEVVLIISDEDADPDDSSGMTEDAWNLLNQSLMGWSIDDIRDGGSDDSA